MLVDPRRLAALQIQLDVLAHESATANQPELNTALTAAIGAITRIHEILRDKGFYLQVPDDYKPPAGIGNCSNSKSK